MDPGDWSKHDCAHWRNEEGLCFICDETNPRARRGFPQETLDLADRLYGRDGEMDPGYALILAHRQRELEAQKGA